MARTAHDTPSPLRRALDWAVLAGGVLSLAFAILASATAHLNAEAVAPLPVETASAEG